MKIVSTILIFTFIFIACNNRGTNENLIGKWINEKEKCTIQLNSDFTFSSNNIPLDISNRHYLMNDKTELWNGTWLIENNQIKLIENESYYYLNINTSLLSSNISLSIKLLEESGDEVIYFIKQ